MKKTIHLATFLGALCAAAPASAAKEDLGQFIRQIHVEGVPYDRAIAFEPKSAVPRLLEMLADPREEAYWPNVVTTLGMLGDPRAVKPLIEFLERDPGARISREHFVAKTNVVMALGYLLHVEEDPRALEYLLKSVRPEIWRDRGLRWRSPFHDSAGRDQQLSKMSILGLALSGRPEVRSTLLSLKRAAISNDAPPFYARIRSVVEEAVRAHETIGRVGLVEYYAQGRQR